MNARPSARAQIDLECIYGFILLLRGEPAAEKFLESARQAMEFLAQYPLAGSHPKWATRHKALRCWVVSKTNFLIYHLPDENGLSIERVLNGRRDVSRIIEFSIEEPPDSKH